MPRSGAAHAFALAIADAAAHIAAYAVLCGHVVECMARPHRAAVRRGLVRAHAARHGGAAQWWSGLPGPQRVDPLLMRTHGVSVPCPHSAALA